MKRVIYRRGKRMTKNKINKKKLFGVILFFIIIIAIGIAICTKKGASTHEPIQEEKPTNETVQNTTVEEEQKNIVDVDIPDTLGGYNVLGQLVLEKIGVTQNILSKTEDASLKIAVTKFYGPKIDEPGNFCICGHNYTGILKDLNKMSIGDEFYIVTKDTKERIDYEIYDMYSCEPEDLSCLYQNQDGNREITLITCNPGGLTRLICKAREIKR